MLRIAFLHTSDVHVATFDKLIYEQTRNRVEVSLTHQVKPQWLADVVRNGITPALRVSVESLLTQLANTADVVVCTCSSLGPIAQSMQREDIFRLDEPMMQQAANNPPVLLTICLESTRTPSELLLRQAFKHKKCAPNFTTHLCDDAWPFFESGDMQSFAQTIAAQLEARLAVTPDVGCIVLAQASMAAAQPLLQHLKKIPVFSSPYLAATRALKYAQSKPAKN